MEIIASVTLSFQQGTSDKEYNLQLTSLYSVYRVEAQWGRRGNVQDSQTKYEGDDITAARRKFEQIKREKIAKGYIEMGGVSTPVDSFSSPVTPFPLPTSGRQRSTGHPRVSSLILGRRRILWNNPDAPPISSVTNGDRCLDRLPTPPETVALEAAVRPAITQVMPPTPNTQTGNHPQLLNMIDEERVEQLLDDDDWGMEEKIDGTHKMVEWGIWSPPRSDGSRVIGSGLRVSNKKGILIAPTPAFWTGITSSLHVYHGTDKPHMLLDGEQIGDQFFVYDILEYDLTNLRTQPYAIRYLRLEEEFRSIAGNLPILRVPLYTGDLKRSKYNQFKAENREGVVFKRLNAVFTAGRPASGGDMLKFKFYATCSARVSVTTTGKRSVRLELLEVARPGASGSWVYVGNCTIPPNKVIPYSTPQEHAIIEVRYLYAYRDGCLFQPTYIGPRDDIDEEECLTTQLKYKREE